MTPYRDSADYPAEPQYSGQPYSGQPYPKPHPRADYHRQSHSSHYRPSPSLPRSAPASHREAARPVAKSPVPRPVLARQRGAADSVGQPQPLGLPTPSQALPRRGRRPGGYVMAGGSMMLALMAFLLPNKLSSQAPAKTEVCQQEVQAESVLSRPELTELLSVPERSAKEAVRQVIAEPFCLMAPVEVREGVTAEREAYPLAFDPQTWLVVLYEGDEYAGYDFSFRR